MTTDLRASYLSYRASLSKDVLKECELYATTTPTKRPEQFPNIYSYLNMIMADFNKAVSASDEALYRQALQNHKTAMMKLQEHMVRELTWTEERDPPSKETGELAVELKGWQYFRYANTLGTTRTFLGREFAVIPYYGDFCKSVWGDRDCVADVDELLLAEKLGEEILKKKIGITGHKLRDDGSLCSVDYFNEGLTINDWKLIS